MTVQVLPIRRPDVVYIYTLAHPITGEVRYVGKTVDPTVRFYQHNNRDEGGRKSRWAKSLKAQGLSVKMDIIDVVSQEEWQFWEEYWIRQMRGWGFNLYNSDFGGGGAGKVSPETRQKISKGLTGGSRKSVRKVVAQYDIAGNLGMIFESVLAAARHFEIRPGGISTASSKNWLCGGMFWRVLADGDAPPFIETNRAASGKRILSLDERRRRSLASSTNRVGRKHSDTTKAKMSLKRGENSNRGRAIVVYDAQKQSLGQWGCIKSACIALDISYGGIQKALSGERKYCKGGYTAAYA